MKRNAHPSNFYIAHALFEGDRFRAGGEWGMLTDAPLLLTALWLGVNVIAIAAWQIWGRG